MAPFRCCVWAARAVARRSHTLCAVYIAIAGDSKLLCLHGLEAHGSLSQPFAGYDLGLSAWQDHDMAVWVYDDELVRIDRHQDVLYRLLRLFHPVLHGWAHVVELLSLCTGFGRVPRANWARRPLHAQRYNFPTQFPTRHAATSTHQTGRAHTQNAQGSGCLVALNQHAYPLLSRQRALL